MFQSIYLRDNLDAILGRLLRLPVAGQPVTILDLSGVPSEVVNVVVSLLCRLIFEFALWSERADGPPLLLVCEEAHRYVPADGTPVFEPTRRAIDRIAKEGRKYGVSLCLVSQRPSELSASSLSQCGTIVALRTSNERDQRFVRTALPDGFDWLIAALPAITASPVASAGEGVSVPMQVQSGHSGRRSSRRARRRTSASPGRARSPTRLSSTARSAAGACSSAEPAGAPPWLALPPRALFSRQPATCRRRRRRQP